MNNLPLAQEIDKLITAIQSNPLLVAVNCNQPQLLQELLKYGANPNCIGTVGTFTGTALLLAVQSEKQELVEQLIKSGANPHLGANISPLKLAKKGDKQELVRIMEEFQNHSALDEKQAQRVVRLKVSSSFVDNFATKGDLEFLTDAEIVCERQNDDPVSFKCHRFVLASCSKYFRQLFEDKDSEASKSGKIVVKNTPSHVMEMFLDLFYKGRLGNLSQDSVEELLKIADKYKILQLKVTCEEELIRLLTISSCVRLLHLAKKFGAEELEAESLDLVQSSFSAVVHTKDFAMLMTDFPDAFLQKM